MTEAPPEAPDDTSGNMPPAVSRCARLSVEVLRKRADFLAAARAKRQGARTMMVQGRDRRDGDARVRVGFTCSKKVGNAVARNRAKRRLRAVAHEILAARGEPGWDYVLIGRAGETGERPFDELRRDLRFALDRLRGGRG
jgi:ribonuclease P protein component